MVLIRTILPVVVVSTLSLLPSLANALPSPQNRNSERPNDERPKGIPGVGNLPGLPGLGNLGPLGNIPGLGNLPSRPEPKGPGGQPPKAQGGPLSGPLGGLQQPGGASQPQHKGKPKAPGFPGGGWSPGGHSQR